MLLALSLWVAAALPVTEVARPAASPVKDPVAQVLVSEQDVRVDPGAGQAAFKAVGGILLQQSDTLVVGPGAWVALVILGNEHVVRLDDDLTLRVGDLALLNAPRQGLRPVQQLDTLLTADERGRTERLIGWHASQTAANTQPVKPSIGTGGGGSKGKSLDLAQKPRESKKDDAMEKEAREVMPPPKPPGGPTPPAPTPTPESLLKSTGPREEGVGIDPELQRCVDAAVKLWGPEVKTKLGPTMRVSARLNDGAVLVRLPLGLPPPPCFTLHFQKQALTATWTSVTVPLR